MPASSCIVCGRRIPRGSRCSQHAVRSDAAPGWRQLRELVLERDGHTCHWCGAAANTVDHVDPASKAEITTDPSRLVAACQPCNSRKRDSLGAPGRGRR